MYAGSGVAGSPVSRCCSKPMSFRHGIGRVVFGVHVFVFLYVCGVGDGGLSCFQVAVRSPRVAAMELDGSFLGSCDCVSVCMLGRGWRAHLFPGSCSQPMSCRHGIGRDVFGVRVFVFLYVCGAGDGGATCFQVAVRSR